MLKRYSFLILALVLLISAAPAALAGGECDGRESHFARAAQLHDMGDYHRALRHYACALQEDPADAIIPILIENVYEDMAQSATAWSRGNEAPPNRLCDPARDHARIGVEAHEAGDDVLADIHLHCALAHDPNHLQSLTILGHIYMNRGETRAARHYFDRAYVLRASYIAIPTSKSSDTLAANDEPNGFVMPDWLSPYETIPKARSPREAIDIAAALRQLPARSERAHVRAGQRILLRMRISLQPREAAALAPNVEEGHPHARCALGRLYMAQGNYAAAFGQLYPLLANGLYKQCPD